MTIVCTSNLQFTLSDAAFEHGLRHVLAEGPDIVALQEALNHRDPVLDRVGADLGYSWARAVGGEPILWKTARYGSEARWVRPVLLARQEYVGHLPGRKDRLPASIATEVGLSDLDSHQADGSIVVAIDYHLTAEVQTADGKYRKDPLHLLRVLRHHREKYRLGRRARMHKRRGRTVHPAGDSNFDGFKLGGFVSCWDHRSGGTLGWRSPDAVFGATRGTKLWTLKTASDHDTLFVEYH